MLANRTDGGEYFDIHEEDFSEKFREEISAEVVNASKKGREPVTLDGGDSMGVSFDANTSELPPGEYTVTVSSENDSESTTITITKGSSSSILIAEPSESVTASDTTSGVVHASQLPDRQGPRSVPRGQCVATRAVFEDSPSVDPAGPNGYRARYSRQARTGGHGRVTGHPVPGTDLPR